MTPTTDDVCRNCGAWVATLVEETGWCAECSGHKRCGRCGELRSPTEFRTDRRSPDGRRGVCSPCIRVDERARWAARIEASRAAAREKSRRYRARNKADAA